MEASRSKDSTTTLTPDRTQAERHIETLTGSPNTPVTFQTFHDSEKARGGKVVHGTLAEKWDMLVDLNRSGHGIFLMVNEGNGNGRRAENVTGLRALFLDDDGSGPKPILFDGQPNEHFPSVTPSLTVQSKRGQHHYFRLVSGEPLDAFSGAQKALASHFSTDKTVSDLPRVMRLAGFFHVKNPSEPTMVRVIHTDERGYAIAQVLAAYPGQASVAMATERLRQDRVDSARAFLSRQPAAVEGDGGDSRTFSTCCAAVRGFDLTDEEAVVALADWNSRCAPPWAPDELLRKVQNAREHGTEPIGARLKMVGAGSAYDGFGIAKQVEHCVPLLNRRFVLLREKDGNERLFEVNDRREVTRLANETRAFKVLHDHLKAAFGEIPPDAVLRNAMVLWRKETTPIETDPEPFCFLGDERLCFQRFDWEPVAGEFPAWEEFLGRLSDREAFMAFVWSCFVPGNESRQYVWLHGEGQDGKSKALGTLTDLFGHAAGALSNGQVANNQRFLASGLYGKRLVVYADCKNPKFGMSELVRNMTSSDPIPIEFKNEPQFMARLRLKLFVASNPKPEFTGVNADTSRIIYIRVAASKNRDDPSWPRHLKDELPAFLNACRDEYARRCPNGGDIRVNAVTTEAVRAAAEDFEGRFHDVWDENFAIAAGNLVPAREVSARLRRHFSNQEISDVKAWMERTHGVKTQVRTRDGRFYEGLRVLGEEARYSGMRDGRVG